MIACGCTINSRKDASSPFLHATLRQIWGEGVCSKILFVLCIHPFLCSSQSMLGVDNHDGSLDECALQEINGTGTLVFPQINQSNLRCQW